MFVSRLSGKSLHIALVALVVSLILNGLSLRRMRGGRYVDDSHYTYIGDDHPTELPLRVDAVGMTFEDFAKNHHYSQTWPIAWHEWQAIDHFPKGHGFVRLGPDARMFAVAMFHQIHCLEMIRQGLLHGPNSHSGHCLNFLRQGALCNADITLETGEEVTHVCRDWTQVYDYIVENQRHWPKDEEQ